MERETRSTASGMLCSHTALTQPLVGWLGGRTGQPPQSLLTQEASSLCHTQLTRRGAGGNIHQRHSLESLSEPWPWNAFLGSAKAISQLRPQGGEIRSAQCAAGEVPLSLSQESSPADASDVPEPLPGSE